MNKKDISNLNKLGDLLEIFQEKEFSNSLDNVLESLDNNELLTLAEKERLYLLIEECAEVQHIACKILRHGYDAYHPTVSTNRSNKRMLEQELEDLEFAIELLTNSDVNMDYDFEKIKERKENYLHYQEF